jgi:alkylation response protein AidB-like acyl-CoA dehydrogenase
MTSTNTLTRSTGPNPAELVARAQSLAPLIWASREQSERERQLPTSLVEAMAAADLFRMWVPRSLGGAEADIATALRVIEEVSRVDGSAGWNLAVGVGQAVTSAYLPVEVAREVFGQRPGAPTAGSIVAKGPAVAAVTDGGYRVSGRWGFASGSMHAAWFMVGCVVMEGDAPRLGPDGAPAPHMMVLPRADIEVIDTWHVGGLRGTGSHDIAAHEAFVPAARSFPLLTSRPREAGTLYRLPLSLLGVSLAPVATGIARAAIDALERLATEKTPAGTRVLLRERTMVQVSTARAEALLRAGRAFLFEMVAEAWEAAAAGELPVRQRALLRLAATHAVSSAARAVDLVYEAGGGSSIYETSPLERCFRDIHTVTQHVAIAPASYEPAGRVLLGMDPGTPSF